MNCTCQFKEASKLIQGIIHNRNCSLNKRFMNKEAQFLHDILIRLTLGAFSIEETLDNRGVLLTVHVQKDDMGRVLGKRAETIIAIRRLIRQYGSENGRKVSVIILEP